MGEAPFSSESVLVIFFRDLPAALVQDIRRKFSDAEVTVYKSRVQEGIPVPPGMLPARIRIH